MPTGDEAKIMKLLEEEGGGELHEVAVANYMGWRVDYARSVLGSMGRKELIDVLKSGRIRLAERGMRAIGATPRWEREQGPRLSPEEKYAKWMSATPNTPPEAPAEKTIPRDLRPEPQPRSEKGAARRKEMRELIAKHKEETQKQRDAWREESAKRKEYVKGLVGSSGSQRPAATAAPSPKPEPPSAGATSQWREVLQKQQRPLPSVWQTRPQGPTDGDQANE